MLIGNRLDICFISLCVSNPLESDLCLCKVVPNLKQMFGCTISVLLRDGWRMLWGESWKKRSVYSVFCHLIMCSDYSREVSTSQLPRERMCKNTKGLIVFLYLVAGPWQTPDSIWSLTKIKWWIMLYRMYTRCKPDPKHLTTPSISQH